MSQNEREAGVRRTFSAQTEDHGMEILHDEGLYRHLRFACGEEIHFRFDVITWPGHLALAGDIADGYVFRRSGDMLNFFNSSFNPDYWAEKLVGRDPNEFNPDLFLQLVRQDYLTEEWTGREAEELEKVASEWERHIEGQNMEDMRVAYDAASTFEASNGARFRDLYEIDATELTEDFLVACCAAHHAALAYFRQKNPTLGMDVEWVEFDGSVESAREVCEWAGPGATYHYEGGVRTVEVNSAIGTVTLRAGSALCRTDGHYFALPVDVARALDISPEV